MLDKSPSGRHYYARKRIRPANFPLLLHWNEAFATLGVWVHLAVQVVYPCKGRIEQGAIMAEPADIINGISVHFCHP
jgi:hypothetical protein